VEDGSVVPFAAAFLTGQIMSDFEPVPLPTAGWAGMALLAGMAGMRLIRRRHVA
jgi:hypothetical protein